VRSTNKSKNLKRSSIEDCARLSVQSFSLAGALIETLVLVRTITAEALRSRLVGSIHSFDRELFRDSALDDLTFHWWFSAQR
jgi:hypothetical protein